MLFTERRPLMIGLIVLSMVVVIVVVIFVVRFARRGDLGGEAVKPTPAQITGTSSDGVVVPPKDFDKQAVESLARLFVERIGSYSNQSNFQNLDDVAGLMTPRARTWADGLKKTQDTSAGYRGVTTKALTAETIDWKPRETARVRIATQRQEERDSAAPQLQYQDAEVRLVFQDDSWLVDEIVWRDAQP
ncbi:MAG: hypothetical protein HY437_00390 [Candidatus Magasanikbacteria bacterium]|nr:hypothetical protein [Candidatus Magasanikbacteria bacterium]